MKHKEICALVVAVVLALVGIYLTIGSGAYAGPKDTKTGEEKVGLTFKKLGF